MLELFRSPDLGAVWLIQSRKQFSELEFWLILAGYDPKTHSFSSRIYLIYVCIFFSIWGFAVLTLLAQYAGQALTALPFHSPLFAATAIAVIALAGIFLVELYFASRSSPFVFSTPDSTLLCMTPVDRRFVGLIWFLIAWIIQDLLLGPAATVLGYAYLEAQTGGTLGPADLPRYILAGLRMLIIIILLRLAAQSLAWALGAWRLGKKDEWILLRWTAPVLGILLAAAWVVSSRASGAGIPTWVWAAAYPIRAGLGAAPLLPGITIALLSSAAGLILLWMASDQMSLARAAQETHGQDALQHAILFGWNDLAREIKQRRRLGVQMVPSRLPARPGMAALIWKNAVQGTRSLARDTILPWLTILGLSIALLKISDWGIRVWMLIFWIILIGGRSVPPLRRDLSRWWLLHQYPYASDQIVCLELGLPLLGITLTGLLSLLLAAWLGVAIPPAAGWLFLPGAAGVSLAAAVDVLRQSRVSRLLAGNVPDRSMLSILLGIAVFGIPGGLAWLVLAKLAFPLWIGIAVMLATCISLDYGLYCWASSLLRRVR